MSSFARKLVSKKKRRFRKNGFDLDLTYITDSIVAMGFPAEGTEGVYRNPMSEVVRYFDSTHKDHYKVYNLCSERSYDPAKFHGRVARYPFDDHNAPAIELFEPFVRDVHQWLTSDKDNVAVIHCKAGKGRTGVMICSYLLYASTQLGNPNTDKWKDPKDVLKYYGAQRTENQKGVTIPSQLRYVDYFSRMLKEHIVYQPTILFLKRITIITVPKVGSTCSPMFVVRRLQATSSSNNSVSAANPGAASSPTTASGAASAASAASNGAAGSSSAAASAAGAASAAAGASSPLAVPSDAVKLYTSRLYENVDRKEKSIEMTVTSLVPMSGDMKIEFFHKDKFKKPAKLFHLWFNTFFVKDYRVTFAKDEIDKANKDKKHHDFDEHLAVIVEFALPDELGLSQRSGNGAAVATSSKDRRQSGHGDRTSMLYADSGIDDATEEEDDLSEDDESITDGSDVSQSNVNAASNTGDAEMA